MVTQENRRKRALIADIVIVLLIAAAMVLYHVGSHRDAQYTEAMLQRATQSENTIQKNRQAGNAIFYQLKLELSEATEGIVCWGDESMAGNRRGSLPNQLDKTVKMALFSGISDEFYSAAGVYSLSELAVPLANMAVCDESMREILARTGVTQLAVATDYTIHASTSSANINLADNEGRPLLFADQQYAKFGTVTIEGIKGYFYKSLNGGDWQHPKLAFGRMASGEETQVPAGTPVYTENAQKYVGRSPVLFFNAPEDGDTDAFVKALEAIVARHTGPGAVVICTTDKDSAADTALSARFGSRYIRNAKTPEDMEAADYVSLALQVYNNLNAQGCFNSVNASVETARNGLKELRRSKYTG